MQSESKSSTKSFELIEAEVSPLEASPVTPRRRWSAAAKERIVAAAMEPGANVSAIARSNGLSPQQVFGPQGGGKLGTGERGCGSFFCRGGDRCRAGRRRGGADCCRRDDPHRSEGAGGSDEGDFAGGPIGMIPGGVSVFVATQPVDFRKGAAGLMALVRTAAPIRSRVRFTCFVRSGPTE